MEGGALDDTLAPPYASSVPHTAQPHTLAQYERGSPRYNPPCQYKYLYYQERDDEDDVQERVQVALVAA
eukprot:3940624-Rhodomonas_salina.2